MIEESDGVELSVLGSRIGRLRRKAVGQDKKGSKDAYGVGRKGERVASKHRQSLADSDFV